MFKPSCGMVGYTREPGATQKWLWSAKTPSGSDMLEIPTLTLRAFL
jgi:hypothetical protein